jgi:hypothetical protein
MTAIEQTIDIKRVARAEVLTLVKSLSVPLAPFEDTAPIEDELQGGNGLIGPRLPRRHQQPLPIACQIVRARGIRHEIAKRHDC